MMPAKSKANPRLLKDSNAWLGKKIALLFRAPSRGL